MSNQIIIGFGVDFILYGERCKNWKPVEDIRYCKIISGEYCPMNCAHAEITCDALYREKDYAFLETDVRRFKKD
jgi:hypothetical protein